MVAVGKRPWLPISVLLIAPFKIGALAFRLFLTISSSVCGLWSALVSRARSALVLSFRAVRDGPFVLCSVPVAPCLAWRPGCLCFRRRFPGGSSMSRRRRSSAALSARALADIRKLHRAHLKQISAILTNALGFPVRVSVVPVSQVSEKPQRRLSDPRDPARLAGFGDPVGVDYFTSAVPFPPSDEEPC